MAKAPKPKKPAKGATQKKPKAPAKTMELGKMNFGKMPAKKGKIC